MRAIKARFDGRKIILPDDARGEPPGEVIVVFREGEGAAGEDALWLAAQERAFAQAWENEDDAVYDSL
ncbi:MAG: hypothetical protein ACYTKD_23905 [Planctomycetota bacterium]|jgi:hypothetical protein